MKIHDIQRKCKEVLNSLVNHGSEVCNNFSCEMEKSYICEKCGYTHYIHLCKQILEAEE